MEQPSDAARAELGLPRTLRPVAEPGVSQQLVFDPSTKQCTHSYRASEPRFTDEGAAGIWRQARRAAADIVLTAIAGSVWADHLVLRGSVLLKSWLGAVAREPGDLDFVVVPADWGMNEDRARQMITGIAAAAQRVSAGSAVAIDAGQAVFEDIWTYERVPGRRMMLPWTASAGHSGYLQLDFVFNEPLPAEPRLTGVSLAGDRSEARILAATEELSLAWKIQWLVTDWYPQAKDLYDAVLLAELAPLSHDLLRQVMITCDQTYARIPVTLADITSLTVDFDAFRVDYPDIDAEQTDLMQRLAEALSPTFAPAAADDIYAQCVAWLADFISECRDICQTAGMAAVQRLFTDQHVGPEAALVVTRELMGASAHSIADALDLITLHQPARSGNRSGVDSWRESALGRAAARLAGSAQTPPAANGHGSGQG